MNLFGRPARGGGVKQDPSDLALQTKNVTKMHNPWTQAPSYKIQKYINGNRWMQLTPIELTTWLNNNKTK